MVNRISGRPTQGRNNLNYLPNRKNRHVRTPAGRYNPLASRRTFSNGGSQPVSLLPCEIQPAIAFSRDWGQPTFVATRADKLLAPVASVFTVHRTNPMLSDFAAPPLNVCPNDSCRVLLERMLACSIDLGASDLHLTTGLPPMLRINGEVFPQTEFEPLSAQSLDAISGHLAVGMNTRSYESTGSLDGAISSAGGVRFRFNIFRRQNTNAISLRRLEDKLHSLAELGLNEQLYEVCDHSHGLVLVAGPTGSGKSTTLAAFIDRINQTRRSHIVTIEDPIEYLHPSRMGLVNQRQIGSDASTFNDALVAAMRQDPDVILVGEIRDLNTIRTAITAAETGHLVFTTVHAGSCIGTIERLVSVFPADEQPGVRQQLALVLRWIIAQQLIIADGPAITEKTAATGIRSRRRVIASEVLRNTDAVANLIASAKSSQIVSSMEAGGALGMQTMEHDLARLWQDGFLTESTAARLSRNADIMRERAERMRRGGLGSLSSRTSSARLAAKG